MPGIVVFAPAIIAAWPAISAAVVGAAAALGMAVAQEATESVQAVGVGVANKVEVDVSGSEITAAELATDEQMVLTQGDVRVSVLRDARGQCRVCVEGLGRSETELRAVGERVVGKITQMFAYNKIMTELKRKGFAVVEEQIEDDESVSIHVRRHVG